MLPWSVFAFLFDKKFQKSYLSLIGSSFLSSTGMQDFFSWLKEFIDAMGANTENISKTGNLHECLTDQLIRFIWMVNLISRFAFIIQFFKRWIIDKSLVINERSNCCDGSIGKMK